MCSVTQHEGKCQTLTLGRSWPTVGGGQTDGQSVMSGVTDTVAVNENEMAYRKFVVF